MPADKAPRFEVNDPDELRRYAGQTKVGDRAICRVRGREVTLEAKATGRSSLVVWEEIR